MDNDIQSRRTALGFFLKNTPKGLLDFDEKAFDKANRERRAAMDKANPPKPVPAKVELNKLRNELFNLQQDVNACGIRVEQEAGNVELIETRVTDALKTKKQHEDAGNLLGARYCEHQVLRLENELRDTNSRLTKRRGENSAAVKALLNWKKEFSPLLEELTKDVG